MHKPASTHTSDSETLGRDVSLVNPTAEKLLLVVAAMQATFGAVEVRHTSDLTKETATCNASDATDIWRGTWRITALD